MDDLINSFTNLATAFFKNQIIEGIEAKMFETVDAELGKLNIKFQVNETNLLTSSTDKLKTELRISPK